MSGTQKVIITGYLAKDVDMRYMPSGAGIASFSIPVENKWRDKQTGEMNSETEWFNITAFGKSADTISQYCHKGSLLYVEGRLKTESWTDQQGQQRKATKVMLERFQMLGGRDNNQQGQPASQAGQYQQPAGQQQASQQGGGFDDFDDPLF